MSESGEIPADVMRTAEALFGETAASRRESVYEVARAIADERERCAKIAEDEDGYFLDWGEDRNRAVAQKTCDAIATAIRNPES